MPRHVSRRPTSPPCRTNTHGFRSARRRSYHQTKFFPPASCAVIKLLHLFPPPQLRARAIQVKMRRCSYFCGLPIASRGRRIVSSYAQGRTPGLITTLAAVSMTVAARPTSCTPRCPPERAPKSQISAVQPGISRWNRTIGILTGLAETGFNPSATHPSSARAISSFCWGVSTTKEENALLASLGAGCVVKLHSPPESNASHLRASIQRADPTHFVPWVASSLSSSLTRGNRLAAWFFYTTTGCAALRSSRSRLPPSSLLSDQRFRLPLNAATPETVAGRQHITRRKPIGLIWRNDLRHCARTFWLNALLRTFPFTRRSIANDLDSQSHPRPHSGPGGKTIDPLQS